MKFKDNILVLVFYTILTIILTYPVIFKIKTHIAGLGGDSFAYMWIFWWFKYALMHGLSPFSTAYLYYPLGVSLGFNDMSYFNALVAFPLQFFFSRIVIYNILWLTSFILAGFGAYLLAFYLTKHRVASFFGGFVYAFSYYHFSAGVSYLNLLSIQFIPFFVLFTFKLFHERTFKHALLASLFLALTTLSSWFYGFYAFLFLALFLVFQFFRDRRSLDKVYFKRILLMFGLFSLIISPFAYPLLREYTLRSDYELIGLDPTEHSIDLLNPFLPSSLHILGKDFSFSNMKNDVFSGLGVLSLSIYALIFLRKKVIFWLFTAVFFFVFSLGPRLQVLGKQITPSFLPYQWLVSLIPPLQITRAPDRFFVMVTLALALLVVYAYIDIIQKISNIKLRKVFPFLLLFIFLFEFMVLPYPITVASTPSFYTDLEAGDYAIIEMPFTLREKAMYYQGIHEKKLVNGYTARKPKDIEWKLLPYLGPISYIFWSDENVLATSVQVDEMNRLETLFIIFEPRSLPQDFNLAFVDHFVVQLSPNFPVTFFSPPLFVRRDRSAEYLSVPDEDFQKTFDDFTHGRIELYASIYSSQLNLSSPTLDSALSFLTSYNLSVAHVITKIPIQTQPSEILASNQIKYIIVHEDAFSDPERLARLKSILDLLSINITSLHDENTFENITLYQIY